MSTLQYYAKWLEKIIQECFRITGYLSTNWKLFTVWGIVTLLSKLLNFLVKDFSWYKLIHESPSILNEDSWKQRFNRYREEKYLLNSYRTLIQAKARHGGERSTHSHVQYLSCYSKILMAKTSFCQNSFLHKYFCSLWALNFESLLAASTVYLSYLVLVDQKILLQLHMLMLPKQKLDRNSLW